MTGVARLGVGIGLVGRRHEVSALAAALDRARAGHPTGVLLSGDAGVGKSRLVAETVQRAREAGFTVLVGRCLDSASSLPYLPFTEIAARLAAARPDLVAAHPALARLLSSGRPAADLAAEDRELGQLRVFDAVLSALDALGAADPALVVIEDLHWADRSSRDLLVFLLSRLTGQRLVVLATYRTDDLHRRHPLRPVLSELVRLPAVERLELAPLGDDDALDLVRQLADGTLAEPLLRRVAQRSEGNAFFAEELVSASSDGLPHGLAEVLLARVEGLEPATQQVLRIASVSGRRVRHGRLAGVSALPDDELEQALRDAVAHHVLVPETGDDSYLFRHALLREAIYHELLPGERSRLHAAYAAHLNPDEPGAAADLAHHALAGHDLPRALAASVRAAREANERDAPAEMLLQAERALDLWEAIPEPETVAGISEVQLTRWAAWGASATGDPDRGSALARRALALAEEAGDPVQTADIGRRYVMRLLELSGHEQEALDVVRRSLALIAGGPPSGDLAWAHAVHARVLCRLDRWAEAREAAEAALASAEAVPDPDLPTVGARADALVSLAVCDEHRGEPELARQRWEEARPLARRSGNLGVELRAHYNVGMSLLDAGRLAEAGDAFAAGEARAAEAGITWSGYGLDLRVAHVIARFMRGDWDDAEIAAEIAGESVSATVASRLTAAGLLTEVARGRLGFAARRAAELHDSQPADEQVVLLLGQVGAEAALWCGDVADAVVRVDEALAGLDAIYPYQLGSIMLAALGVAAHVERVPRDVEAARVLVTVAEETAVKGLPRASALGPEGRAWLLRARAELTRLNGPDPDAWTAVVEAFGYETGGNPLATGYRQAYARLRRAEARLAVAAACGAHTTAAHAEVTSAVVEDLQPALATARHLGAAPLEGAVRAMAERAGVRLDAAAPRAAAPDVLTPRERSVLALVAGGRTNRQVGAELFISEKTVSVHLSRVMAKLGASSRTEAVSVAYARGLLGVES
jgi:DNA-binding CsgD family transcriptional regulator/tetratricopeptide (TPR) repeat protein